jgi:DNA-binding Lrp family transcriptional regulator
MPTAFVLLNTEIGAENRVQKALKELEGVEEVHGLWGVYDIIVNVQADTMEELKNIISKKIDKIEEINTKLTMIVSDKAPVSFADHKPQLDDTTVKQEAMPLYA